MVPNGSSTYRGAESEFWFQKDFSLIVYYVQRSIGSTSNKEDRSENKDVELPHILDFLLNIGIRLFTYLLICLFSSIPTYTKEGVYLPFADRNKQKSFSGSISLTVMVSSIQSLKKNVPYSVFITKSNKYFFETIQDKTPTQEFKCLFHLLHLLGSM